MCRQGLPLLLGMWAVASVMLLLGWRARAGAATMTTVVAYVLLLDQQLFGNNLYLLGLVGLLLTVADSSAVWSLDARRAGYRPRIPAWPVRLLMLQVTLVYLFAAAAKLNPVFLSGGMMAAMDGALAFPESWRVVSVMAPLSAAAVLVEIFIALGLWSARLRVPAVALGLGLHASIALFMGAVVELTIFMVVTTSLYVLFFEDRFPQPAAIGGVPDPLQVMPAQDGGGAAVSSPHSLRPHSR